MSGRTEPLGRRGAAIGVAAAGVLAGHRLAYLVVDPDPVVRDAVLHRTGHAYLSFASELASVVALVGLAALVLGRVMQPGRPAPGPRELITRLAGFQVLAFVSMEVIERVASAAGLGDLTQILPAGVAIQLLLSVVTGLVLGLVVRCADRAVALLGRVPLPASLRTVPGRSIATSVIRIQAPLAAGTIRGPPSA
jgi:hypothetical protein